ncbi:MAG: MBL fold metallo-hydrolase [SAR86 cluster bacterium]|uniref:MBL fold metallo-hydrolase n=1 Tax=SAR86 cluster bacterium TaxID=2030880 RepID=A0A2A4MH00_9GAMM|nr:MAG: MBL fold metallo-hydrolase [SAR86 cluster bacterium]
MAQFLPGVPVSLTDSDSDLANSTGIPVRRVLGLNAGPMTGPGTNSYLIGRHRLALIDPGPVNKQQIDNFMQAIGEYSLEWILVTHTHGDHSPAAVELQRLTGAKLIGMVAPQCSNQDQSFTPDRVYKHGEVLDCGEFSIEIIHTPGHVSNHFCYLLKEQGMLFTGDHILQGTTSVILPPDGDMAAYIDSLQALKNYPLKRLAPGHGEVMENPLAEIDKLLRHRQMREQKIVSKLRMLTREESNVTELKASGIELDVLVLSVYDDVAASLLPWAKKTLLAHLIKLQTEKTVVETNGRWYLL